jgi:hypothetical protein
VTAVVIAAYAAPLQLQAPLVARPRFEPPRFTELALSRFLATEARDESIRSIALMDRGREVQRY